jgi:hypothetical protein
MPLAVHTIKCIGRDLQRSTKLRVRNWGYYFAFKDALHVVKRNETDIAERKYYNYAVISRVGEGPLAIPKELGWWRFEYSGDVLKRVRAIKKPKTLAGFVF